MSPKPTAHLIQLRCNYGIAGHFLWEKEVLCDYVADRIGNIQETIFENSETLGITGPHHYLELCNIANVLRKNVSTGLHSKIDLSSVFGDIRSFVQWDKEEVVNYLIHQVVALDLPCVFEGSI